MSAFIDVVLGYAVAHWDMIVAVVMGWVGNSGVCKLYDMVKSWWTGTVTVVTTVPVSEVPVSNT